LTHRGACLSGRQVEWTFLQPDNTHSGGNRTAGDDDALASPANELRDIRSETAKLFIIECIGARPSKNAGAELEENAPGFPVHAELLHKPENESAQKQFPRIYQTTIVTATEIPFPIDYRASGSKVEAQATANASSIFVTEERREEIMERTRQLLGETA
jgi:hypothetical protein